MQGLCLRLQYSSPSFAVSLLIFFISMFILSNKNTGSSAEKSAFLEIVQIS